ncbi:hypothetical protein U1Q18_009645 [Sarracenia purpurea var. burkii]
MALRLKLLGKELNFEHSSQSYVHPLSCSRVCAFFSSWSLRNPIPDVEQFHGSECGHVKVKEIGVKKSGFLSSCNNPCDVHRENFRFDDPDEDYKSEKEEEEVEIDSDDDLRVLDMFNANQREWENFRRAERDEDELTHPSMKEICDFRSVDGDEDEVRHPLVKEICRLIDLRSAWTPKLESELRHLLRILKPQQICAVLRSQNDERVALKFFYWADRQWRYRHDPIVYYAMLEVLSKTKLRQGARRVLHLMMRRGIEH